MGVTQTQPRAQRSGPSVPATGSSWSCGQQVPLYLLGVRMLERYPQLSLFENQGLGVAGLSYDRKMGIGLVGDWDLMPDLSAFAGTIEASFEELRRALKRR